MSLRHGARLAALLAPVVLLLPAAAHAEQVVITDGAGDAKSLNVAAEFTWTGEDAPPFFDAPAETSADITQTTVAHGKKRVTLTLRFRDLVESSQQGVSFRVFTPTARYTLEAGTMEGRGAGAQLYPDRLRDAETFRPCRTVRARYDLTADLVTVSFPTACIDKPEWVQVSAVASRISVTPHPDGSATLAGWADDAFRSGLSVSSLGRSPKVHRG